jgi:hypothetical protein
MDLLLQKPNSKDQKRTPLVYQSTRRAHDRRNTLHTFKTPATTKR